jgi:glycosyltransferase involved in cell wall biosynthesis
MKDKKIIGVDLRCLPANGTDGAGVAHAARALCKQFLNYENRTNNIDFRFYVPEGARWEVGDVVRLVDTTGKSLRKVMQYKPCDLLFVPGGSIAPAIKVPAIPWVHDLIIFEYPEWFDQSWLQRKITTYLFAKGLRNAPIIFAVSQYTKIQMIKLLGIDESKIIVTGEGGDATIKNYELRIKNAKQEAKEFCTKELGLERQFVLCLGTVEPRKNVAMLIRAWKKAKQKSASAPDLVVAGANGWKYEDVEAEIKNLSASEDQFFYRYKSVTDDQKRTLILAADMVCAPSLDEGFGLVALEAMQAGTPVAVSNSGALPEVVGEAGMVIDPNDEDGWSSAMLTCVSDSRACKMRSELGFRQAKKWSWEDAAEKVYQTIITKI